MNKVRYEFVMVNPNGISYPWGYRTKKEAAKKRFEELQGWVKTRPSWKNYTFECYKIISTETRHPADF